MAPTSIATVDDDVGPVAGERDVAVDVHQPLPDGGPVVEHPVLDSRLDHVDQDQFTPTRGQDDGVPDPQSW